uniref:Integrase catalytic domain-containing protein n=1 Tax=Amphimedon queenslandica TaxID=400682 RepID=A0A1X7U675_AMPQE
KDESAQEEECEVEEEEADNEQESESQTGHLNQRLSTVHIMRRSYHVPGPNYVWHIDGNHKLISWRIVIHGGINGYSRVVVFLKPSTDNHAHTMLSCFENGVFEYGLPTRIRSDLGGENVEVWRT